jgi:hypothetical protein
LEINDFESSMRSVIGERALGLSLTGNANRRKVLMDCFVAINAVAGQRRRTSCYTPSCSTKKRGGVSRRVEKAAWSSL